MDLISYIKNNKFLILVLFVLIYLIYNDKCYRKNVEHMTNTQNEEVEKGLEEFYNVDIQSMKNLAAIAKDLTKDNKLFIPGNLIVEEDLTMNKTKLPEVGFLKKGSIMAFNGKQNIPDGWAICNGSKGTPDLRARFIYGKEDNSTQDVSGGQDTIILTEAHLPTHTHTLTEQAHHTHDRNKNDANSVLKGFGFKNSDWGCMKVYKMYGITGGSGGRTYMTGLIDANGEYIGNNQLDSQDWGATLSDSTIAENKAKNKVGEHTHTLTTKGNSQSIQNMPPYYTLVWIMKL